jgi:hypothetical protein
VFFVLRGLQAPQFSPSVGTDSAKTTRDRVCRRPVKLR